MLSPDLQFMVQSTEIIDEEGYAHRGSRLTLIERGQEPPEWRMRDFGFAAYSDATATGLKQVNFGKRIIWAFASAREHCEEIVVFRKGTDTRKKWDADSIQTASTGSEMFFIMRSRQITSDTPLFRQFNGEWGFWESFYVPLLDEQQTMQTLSLMDPAMCEDYFVTQGLPVTRYTCPEGSEILTIPDDLVVQYELKVACKEMETWSDICNKIDDDMKMTDSCVIEYKHFKKGDECIEAYHEMTGIEDHARMIKRDFEQLKLPVILTFNCEMRVAQEWDPDMVYLQHKYDSMGTVYHSNLMGGFSSCSGPRADPWGPVARLAINALGKIMARHPDIRTVLDIGCGDMAWIQYWLQDNPMITYVGADITSFVLATNFRRFPKLQFIQTDLSCTTGIEVLPQGCDLVIAKDVFNHMVLPDAINAIKRVVGTRPRFLLTHVHEAADNTGWEKRIDKHLHYTRYDYNKPPFSLPYPATDVQRISDEAYFVLYEIIPEEALQPPPRFDRMSLPKVSDTEKFSTVVQGELAAAKEIESNAAANAVTEQDTKPPVESGDKPSTAVPNERTTLTKPVTELPDKVETVKAIAERKPIKGLPSVEFRARCDLIFDKFNKSCNDVLKYEELAAMMEASGRPVKEYDAYSSLCKRLGCDPNVGLTRKDVYTFFEKAPQALWEEAYRNINPLAQMVRKGAETMPKTVLEKPMPNFLFVDEEQFANLYVEINSHLFHGAAESITGDHIQAYFGKQRLELHICAPGSYGSKDIYIWKLIIAPLSAEVVPEDCTLEMEETTGRFGSKKITIKLMKVKKGKKWYKPGQAVTGQNII